MEWHTVTVLRLPYILVTVCTDIVRVRIGMAYRNCTVATVHIGNSVHCYTDSEDWNGIQ